MVPKAKGLFIELKYQKFQVLLTKMTVKKKKKWSNVMNCKKPNEKLQRYVIILLGEVIYVHFYNWDKPLDLVLVMYDLIKLIIEVLF